MPLSSGVRVLEIGCGTGAMAREMLKRIGDGKILAIDRSARAINQAIRASRSEIQTGKLVFRRQSVEQFTCDAGEPPFDIAIAIRVGALDGRHPELAEESLRRIARALGKKGKLFIDGGNPLREINLEAYR